MEQAADRFLFSKSIADSFKDQKKLISALLCTTLLSILPVGYHIIVLNVPTAIIQQAIQQNLQHESSYQLSRGALDVVWAFIVACQSIGAFCGCLLLPKLNESCGTKKAMMVYSNIILIISSALFFVSFYYGTLLLLIIGRLLVGVYTGLNCALVPIYIQELAPKRIKGALGCFVHIGVCVGSAFGAFFSIDSIFGTLNAWHLLLALPIVCAIIQISINHKIPDAPNYYLITNDRAGAAAAIRFYYSYMSVDDDFIIQEYRDTVTKVPHQISFKEAFADKDTRCGIILGMIVSGSQIFSGSMAAVSYSTSMFTAVSFINFLIPFIPTLGSLFSIVLTLPALKFVETCGRKELLLNTMVLCAIANYLLTIFSLVSEAVGSGSWASICFAFTFLILGLGYNLGTGPVSYFIPAELVSPNASSVALGCSVAMNWLCTMITNLLYYPFIEFAGGWSYLMFAIPTTIAIIVLHYKLPKEIEQSTKESSELLLTCNYSGFETETSEYGTFDSRASRSSQSRLN